MPGGFDRLCTKARIMNARLATDDLMNQKLRTFSLRFALLAALLTPVFHIVVLAVNGQNPISTPVSELSRNQLGVLQSIGLVLFGCAHLALAATLGGLARGRLLPWGRLVLVGAGIGLFYIAWYFRAASEATLYSPDANDPLWVVASLTGLAMGLLQPGLARLARGLGLFSTLCLGAWIWLVPVILLVNDSWLGAYERLVGSVYIIWVAGVALGLLAVVRRQAAQD